ncbi:UvrD-helicase domain-containing protein [Aeromicrobium sp. CF4.19]|uniref:UvrD-helicase domain-containing protein n=1 Tax=Aeromicrobium sp. CF4.19 TaxID=3373082 RepID=UPI003EE6453C
MRAVRDIDHLRDLLDIPFSEAQAEAITAGLDRPGAIIAGAGSGKTTVMAARVLWLVGHLDVPPERILGLTFTNKAAAELGQRIRAGLEHLPEDPDEPRGDPVASTYHAFAGSLIAEHGLRLGIEPDLRIVTDASRFQRMARVIESHDGPLEHIGTHVPTLVGQVMALDSQLSEHLVEPQTLREHDAAVVAEFDALGKPALLRDAAATARRRTELSVLVERYRAAKAAEGVMDFSDQMAWGARLAALPEVGEAMRERYGVVLLDEYQDTSVAQRDLLRHLFSGLPVTAVGDPAQGIYGWRGAATGNLEDFLEDFPASDGARGRQFALVETRRCAPEIIDVANHLASPFYATSAVVQPLVSALPPGGRVDVALHATVGEEIAALVAEVVRVHDAGTSWKDVAILVRVARENGEIVKALRDAHVPFEIVGLAGLLAQPEVLDVLSLLEVVEDVTANPALLRLLSGPRWNIGPRDLALLGRRAGALSGRSGGRDDETTLADELARAVEGTDPTEVVLLADALDDPGELLYDPSAPPRFADLSRVIRLVRSHVGEPLLDLARRAVRALDVDIELEAGDVAGGTDNLALFLEAVAAYGQTDRYASLSGLVAYLRAEQDFNDGMEVSTPSESDSVKLLTVHKAKGLEWDTVLVPLVSETVFPSGGGRPNWTTSTHTLPASLRGDAASLPELAEWTPSAGAEYKKALRQEALMEELRLGYVAYTRAKRRVVVTGHWWGRTQLKPRGPSAFLTTTRDWLAEQGVQPLHWAPAPAEDETNPNLVLADGIAWPAAPPPLQGRRALAAEVVSALEEPGEPAPELPTDRLAELSADIDLLLAEAEAAAAPTRVVPVPQALSATAVLAMHEDEAAFARSLARPMPRRPSGAARFGTRFHAWVEAHYGQQPLLDPTELPGQGDVDLASDAELDEVIAMFEAGPYGDATPHAIEAPFSIVLAGQQVIGRIDAVFGARTPDGPGFEVVDWKTSRTTSADPLQLSLYRLAWAELQGIDPARVTAAFYYVRLGEVQRFGADELLGREALERLAGEAGPTLTP